MKWTLWITMVLRFAFQGTPGYAETPEKERVAVVGFDSATTRIKAEEFLFLADVVRKAAADGLDNRRYSVVDRQTMEVLLGPRTLACLNGSCLVEIGRALQASCIIGGSVREVGGNLGLTLEAYETRTGVLLASENDVAATPEEAILVVRVLAPKLVRRAFRPPELPALPAPVPSMQALPATPVSGPSPVPIPDAKAGPSAPRDRGPVERLTGPLIREVLADHREVLAQCTHGTVTEVRVLLVIAANGRVVSVTPAPGLPASIGQCLTKRLSDVRFPENPGPETRTSVRIGL